MRYLLVTLLVLLISATSCFSQGGQAMITIVHIDSNVTFRKLYEDEKYVFAAVDRGEHAGSLFVCNKEQNSWARVNMVYTKGAHFGRSPTLKEALKAEKGLPAIEWDFRSLSEKQTVALPLSAGGAEFFPDKVEKGSDGYLLYFHSRWEIPNVETMLRLPFSLLLEVFWYLPWYEKKPDEGICK